MVWILVVNTDGTDYIAMNEKTLLLNDLCYKLLILLLAHFLDLALMLNPGKNEKLNNCSTITV